MSLSPLGLYIHIPFCVQKCRYCDFYSITDPAHYDPFATAVCAEINHHKNSAQQADTIYFGGGTPSLLGPRRIAQVLETTNYSYTITNEAEITLEVNPGTVSKEDFDAYQAIGINRINIGIQSFSDENLSFLGRCHTRRDAIDAIHWAVTADFSNVGIDLIYGLPGQDRKSWQTDLDEAISFHPEHISCYMLTYEPGTPLDALKRSGRIEPMGENESAVLFTATSEILTRAGYDHYEISNFARNKSLQSRHNQKYWYHLPYRGFGPAAHSFYRPIRSWNVKNVQDYISRIHRNAAPMENQETLTQEQLMMEAIFLGLRTKEGVRLTDFENNFQNRVDTLFVPLIEELTRQGLLNIDSHRMALTQQGMLFHDHISSRFAELL